MTRYSFFQRCFSLILVLCCLLFSVWCQSEESPTLKAQIDSYQKQLATDATRVDIRLQLAKVYLQIEAYTQAVAEYREVISFVGTVSNHNPALPKGYYGLGLAYAGLEKFEEAIEAYQMAIQYAPEWAHIHASLGAGYASLHRYDEALDAYKTAHDLKPDDAMIHHQLGNIYSKRGKRSQAITYQQRAIAILPTLASAHYQLGLLYSQENRVPEAISAYETAYSADPELIEALYNLAQVHIRNGNKQVAREKMQLFEKRKVVVKPIQDLRGALQRTIEPTQRAGILANIGRIYLKSELYEKAVSEYEKAIALNPKSVEAYNGVGIAYAMLKRYSNAIDAQNEALALQPEFAEAYAGLGLVYLMQNEYDLALTHYRRVVTLNPQFLDAHLKIGIILLNQQQYAEAASAYQKAIELNPDKAETYHNLGLCYAHQGKTAEALSNFEWSAKVAQKNQGSLNGNVVKSTFLPETYYMIGELQAQQENYEAAESAYLSSGLPKAYDALAQLSAKIASTYQKQSKRGEKLSAAASYAQTAIRLNPNIASYHNTLALIAYRKGDYQMAETSIRKAIKLDPKNRNYQEGLKQILKK